MGSEMCIRDSGSSARALARGAQARHDADRSWAADVASRNAASVSEREHARLSLLHEHTKRTRALREAAAAKVRRRPRRSPLAARAIAQRARAQRVRRTLCRVLAPRAQIAAKRQEREEAMRIAGKRRKEEREKRGAQRGAVRAPPPALSAADSAAANRVRALHRHVALTCHAALTRHFASDSRSRARRTRRPAPCAACGIAQGRRAGGRCLRRAAAMRWCAHGGGGGGGRGAQRGRAN